MLRGVSVHVNINLHLRSLKARSLQANVGTVNN
jgi:hypothetical protein